MSAVLTKLPLLASLETVPIYRISRVLNTVKLNYSVSLNKSNALISDMDDYLISDPVKTTSIVPYQTKSNALVRYQKPQSSILIPNITTPIFIDATKQLST